MKIIGLAPIAILATLSAQEDFPLPDREIIIQYKMIGSRIDQFVDCHNEDFVDEWVRYLGLLDRYATLAKEQATIVRVGEPAYPLEMIKVRAEIQKSSRELVRLWRKMEKPLRQIQKESKKLPPR
jgi:hypothetical protein